MNCWIKIPLPSRRECTPIKIAPVRAFAAVSLLEYGGLNPILPFLGGRSDVACRVAILSTLHCYPPPRRSPLIIACRPPRDKWVGWRCVRWHPRVGVYVGRWRYPVMPPSLLCEDFPARPLSACLHGDGSVAEHKKQAVSPDTACHAWWDGEEFGGRLLVPALRLL